MITLRFERRWFTDAATEGEASVDGAHECWSLEDRAPRPGDPKRAGLTAIPPGRYPLTWKFSPRFKRMLLTVGDVPGFVGIRIHAGNRSKDTEGCLLVGLQRTEPTDDWIGQSGVALARLEQKLVPRLLAGEAAHVEIIEAPEIDERR